MSNTSSHLPYPDPDSYFTIGNYINNPEKFYGREEEIRTIVNRLKSMQATSIVGKRRIGKSSLLYHLYQAVPQKIGNDSYQFIYSFSEK